MGATIYKINKSDLTELGSYNLSIENIQGLVIPHMFDGNVSNSSTISFTIEIVDKHVPYLQEEFMVVIREKVDASATGPNAQTITDVGEDMGKLDYKKKVPHRPWDLPEGFVELKGDNE